MKKYLAIGFLLLSFTLQAQSKFGLLFDDEVVAEDV